MTRAELLIVLDMNYKKLKRWGDDLFCHSSGRLNILEFYTGIVKKYCGNTEDNDRKVCWISHCDMMAFQGDQMRLLLESIFKKTVYGILLVIFPG
jgi:hypothetical protein